MPDLHQPGPDRSTHDEGPVPEDNLPGHHPADEQDKPDPADFVAKAKEVAARKGGAKKVAAKADTGGEADAPSATPEADVTQAEASPGAPDPAPAPAPVREPDPSAAPTPNPVAAVLAFQWRVATFPLRLAGEAIERLRRPR